jgi:ATP-dependent DNA helicase RecQ
VNELTQHLQHHFGFAGFRPGQEEVIRAVLARRDVLAVMPTGQGKSLCYQLPATLLPGLTVVVSPLIALMQDQVESLRTSPRRRFTRVWRKTSATG